MAPTDSFAERPFEGRAARSAVWLTTTLIVAALLTLLVVPPLLERQVDEARDEIQHAADPARSEVTVIQYLLARQTSTLRGFFISRDSSFLAQYREFAAAEAAAQARLAPLAHRLGGDVLAHAVELRTRSDQWHDEVAEELRSGAQGGSGVVPFEWDLYLEALEVAGRLDEAVLAATRERRDRIFAVDRQALGLQAGLGALALAAALAAAWLSQRVRRLAHEAEARRREAERALAETAAAVESKARLIRGVTHDVKNPLGAADGYAELLEMGLKGPLTPAQAEMVAAMRRSIRGATEIIRDLLDVSRVDAGELGVDLRPVLLAALVRETAEEYRGSADAAGHALHVDEGPPDLLAHADAARVRQILGNLLGNAIKYTPRGGRLTVRVEAAADGVGPAPGRWSALRVSDTGAGIPPEERERIFEEFHRIPGTAAAGHGLGLAISRRIARLMDGDITVEGEPGLGSTFVLWLRADDPPS